MEINEEITNYFAQAIAPVQLHLLEGTEVFGEFKTVLTIDTKAESARTLIYDLPPLLRILAQRRNLMKKELLEQIDPKEELCLIIDWVENQKRIAIFNLENNQELNREKLMQLINEAKEKWNRWFVVAKEQK